MSSQRSPKALAKMLAYMLGRRPDEFGLIPDAEGFVKVKDILKALHEEEEWGYVRLAHLNEVFLTVRVPAIEIAQNRIRAGNQRALSAETAPQDLPKVLFACIRRKAWPHVNIKGIQATAHPKVVLSSDRAMAERLGKRIDSDPVILTIKVQVAQDAGVSFYQQAESIYLADHIPPDCISGPPLPKDKPEDTRKPHRPAAGPQPPVSPGSFQIDFERVRSPHVPGSLKRRAQKSRRIDRKRLKPDKRQREKPPWRK